MRQHGIWVEVGSDANYASDKNFGGRHEVNMRVNVGTSSSNSHFLNRINVRRHLVRTTMLGGCEVWRCSIQVGTKTVYEEYFTEKWEPIDVSGERAKLKVEQKEVEMELNPEHPRVRKIAVRKATKYTA